MEENHAPQPPQRSAPVRRRRRRKRLGFVWALVYVAFVIGVSTLLATFGWTMACDVLALNKEEHSAIITLPDDIFTPQEVKEKQENEAGETVTVTKTVQVADMGYVANLLKENGLIEQKWLFRLFASITGSGSKLRPGTYTLDTDMDYRALITNLGSSAANRATVSVTFVEGSTTDQIFQLMEEKGVCTVSELQDVASSHPFAFSFLQEIPLGDYRRLEGYLFPDTYTFYLNEDPKSAINKMLLNFDARFTDEMREAVGETEYSIRDILTIASLIEKETDSEDRANIASVIYNRLERPTSETAGYLNIDASISYVTGRTVTIEDYASVDDPYNTYLYTGLPPGPIANPGMASIRAAMNPANTGYYYYVLNPSTNRHEFTSSYSEHQRLVDQYAGG